MTREEAINTLKEIKITLETYNSWSKTQSFSKYPQALEKAISAISALSADVCSCYTCEHWNSETKGCKRNPSVEEWSENDYCSYYFGKPLSAEPTIPMFAESAEAYKKWTGEDMGKTEPSDLISRAEAVKAFKEEDLFQYCNPNDVAQEIINDIPSAEAVQRWIPFTCRPMTEEEQKDYPNCTFIFDCVLPDDGDEILVSNGRFVWMDEFCNDIDGCYLDGGDDIDEDMAWMPLPKPYKGGEDE